MFTRLFPLVTGALCTLSVIAQPGTLDPTFGDGGILFLQPGTVHDVGHAVVALEDNTLLVAGVTRHNDTMCAVVAHLFNDGTLDPAFGEGGYSYIVAGAESYAYGMVVTSDGGIVVAGLVYPTVASSDILLAKLLPTGAPDISFGDDGIVRTNISNTDDGATDLTLQPDGRIVVAGSTIDANSVKNGVLLRYNADGSLDNTFSGDGITVVTAWSSEDELRDVAVLQDGSIIGVGSADVVGDVKSMLVKVDANGTYDNGFGGDGVLIPGLNVTADQAWGILAAGQQFLVCGFLEDVPGERDVFLAQFNADGTLDSGFNGNGITTVNTNVNEIGFDLALQPDGKALVCGTTGVFGFFVPRDFLLARFNTDGTPDTGFGVNGVTITSIQADFDDADGMTVQPDGRIVLTGFTAGFDNDLIVARYLADGCALFPSVSPENLILCPDGMGELTTQVYDSYQWYRNGSPVPGATTQTLTVEQFSDAGYWFKVEVTQDTCSATSDSVLVDSYAFLPPSIMNQGDEPNAYGNDGERIFCDGDSALLVLGAPYDTNVQWYNYNVAIPGAQATSLWVTGTGSFSVEAAPSVCPEFIQNAGVAVTTDFHPIIQPTIYPSGDLLCPEPEGLSSQWYYGGQPVVGLGDCVLPIDAGAYTVFVDYGDSCSVLSEPYVLVGLDELARPDIQAFPIPASTTVTLTWPGGSPTTGYRILDLTGRVVLQHARSCSSPLMVDVSGLVPGRYVFAAEGRSPVIIERTP